MGRSWAGCGWTSRAHLCVLRFSLHLLNCLLLVCHISSLRFQPDLELTQLVNWITLEKALRVVTSLWLDQTAHVEWNQGTLFGFLRQSGSFALGQLGKMGQDCVLPLFVFFGLLAYLSVNLGWENLGHWGWFQDNVCRCSGLGQLSCGLPFDACKECLHPVGGDWLVSACLGWGAAAVVTVLCAF